MHILLWALVVVLAIWLSVVALMLFAALCVIRVPHPDDQQAYPTPPEYVAPEALGGLAAHDLRPLGFTFLGYLTIWPPNQVTGAQAVWASQDGTVLGLVTYMRATLVSAKVVTAFVSYGWSEEGESVAVALDRRLSITSGTPPWVQVAVVPRAERAALLGVQQQLVRAAGAGTFPSTLRRFSAIQEVAATQCDEERRALAWRLDTGRLKPAAHGKFRLPLRQALWQVSQVDLLGRLVWKAVLGVEARKWSRAVGQPA